mmetsp:Transcript_29353/g.45355  ORF Transcript_29353/g.45355 Transcript_29353/m.45355 type:complete len:334 (-) Transcript_29353:35-1036(-)
MLTERSRGYLALAGCVVLWVVTGVLTQVIFIEENYAKPLFVALINNALFAFGLCFSFSDKHRRVEDIEEKRGKHEIPHLGDKNKTVESILEGTWTTLMIASPFAFLHFLSNYLFNISLEYTTVSSTTAISTTTAIWCLLFSWLFGIDNLSFNKILGLFFSLLGTFLISFEDLKMSPSVLSSGHTLQGDILSLLSAVIFSLYTVLFAILLPKEVKMMRFIGYMGISTFIFLFPILFLAHLTGLEPVELPSFPLFLLIFFNAFIGTFVAQYLWSYAVLWTSPLVAGLGSTLTIPLAEIVDWMTRGVVVDGVYGFAMVFIMAGFVVVTCEKSVMKF